jgi:hypothetical protein
MRNRSAVYVIAGCGLLSALWVSGITAAGKPSSSTPVVTFWFVTGMDVSGDGAADGVYKDYRLADATAGVNDVNYCTEASPTSTGLLFIRLNRKLDGDAGFQYCEKYLPERTQTPRDMTLHIRSYDACTELHSANLPAPPEVLAPYVIDDDPATAGCTFGHFAKPRIRISNDIFARRTTSTPVAFLEETYDVNDISYEVQTDIDAVVTGESNTRTVSSTGTAHLVRFVPGQKPVTVTPSFPLTFSIVIVRSTI